MEGGPLSRLRSEGRITVKNPIRRVRPERTGIRAPLGDLELAVMRHVWACGEQGCSGSEVQRILERERPVALTTVLTTLDRLSQKGILHRQREGKAYVYRPALTEQQLEQRIVDGVLGGLIDQFPSAVATFLCQRGIAGTSEETLKILAQRVADLRSASAIASGSSPPSADLPPAPEDEGT